MPWHLSVLEWRQKWPPHFFGWWWVENAGDATPRKAFCTFSPGCQIPYAGTPVVQCSNAHTCINSQDWQVPKTVHCMHTSTHQASKLLARLKKRDKAMFRKANEFNIRAQFLLGAVEEAKHIARWPFASIFHFCCQKMMFHFDVPFMNELYPKMPITT